MANYGLRIGHSAISGLEWGGNEETNTQQILRWLNPFPIYDATYIFRHYPKGPKTGTNPHYWTLFFWGNYGSFIWDGGVANTYYGMHPYPFDGFNASTGQNWEISTNSNDYPENDPNNGAQVTWNRWYTSVIRCWRESATVTHHEFYYDWDLWNSSGNTQGMFSRTNNDVNWADQNPPTPSIVVGEAPPNDANTASWGDYTGREQYKGIIRGMQFYSQSLTLTQVANELTDPGSIIVPWYYNRDPKPTDVTDKSGSGNNPSFPAGTPALWVP